MKKFNDIPQPEVTEVTMEEFEQVVREYLDTCPGTLDELFSTEKPVTVEEPENLQIPLFYD